MYFYSEIYISTPNADLRKILLLLADNDILVYRNRKIVFELMDVIKELRNEGIRPVTSDLRLEDKTETQMENRRRTINPCSPHVH